MRLAWSPEWASHVEGEARPRKWDDESCDPIRVDLRCLVCGATWLAHCYSGRWDRRVAVFAIIHYECWYKPMDVE